MPGMFDLRSDDGTHERARRLRGCARGLIAALITWMPISGCGDDDKTDDGTDDGTTVPDETTDPCAGMFRPESGPPDFTWDVASTPIGGTTLRYYPTNDAIGLVALFDGGGDSNFWFRE